MLSSFSKSSRPARSVSSVFASAGLVLAGTSALGTAEVAQAPKAHAATGVAQWRVDGATKLAKSRIGRTPYRYGGTSLYTGADCSGFTKRVYSKKGVYLPRTAGAQKSYARPISARWRKPGDLVFFQSGGYVYHVGIYVGSGYIVDAPSSGRYVGKRKIWTRNVSYGTLRKVG